MDSSVTTYSVIHKVTKSRDINCAVVPKDSSTSCGFIIDKAVVSSESKAASKAAYSTPFTCPVVGFKTIYSGEEHAAILHHHCTAKCTLKDAVVYFKAFHGIYQQCRNRNISTT